MIQALILMHFHPGEYLLTQEPCLDGDFRSTVDQPWEVDGDSISFVSWGIQNEVIWKELIITYVETSVFDCCMLLILLQMVIIILKKIRLLIRLAKLIEVWLLLCFLVFRINFLAKKPPLLQPHNHSKGHSLN